MTWETIEFLKAAERGDVERLLRFSANVNATDDDWVNGEDDLWMTALHLASKYGRLAVVQCLLKKGGQCRGQNKMEK